MVHFGTQKSSKVNLNGHVFGIGPKGIPGVALGSILGPFCLYFGIFFGCFFEVAVHANSGRVFDCFLIALDLSSAIFCPAFGNFWLDLGTKLE